MSMEREAQQRIAEMVDSEEEARLRNIPISTLIGSEFLVPAILSRLGPVRAALDGHGGGIKVDFAHHTEEGVVFILDLTGACLSCGAAPGTLDGIKSDLERDEEIHQVLFSNALLATFDDLGREFILAHGHVQFVSSEAYANTMEE